jgi:hypothetical protein
MTKDSIEEARRSLVARLYPEGIPLLWCPTLTHFSQEGRFDTDRIRAHLQVLAPYMKGLLVPGSTGEGWEMSDADSRNLLSIILDIAQALNIPVLVGVLKTDMPSGRRNEERAAPSAWRPSSARTIHPDRNRPAQHRATFAQPWLSYLRPRICSETAT